MQKLRYQTLRTEYEALLTVIRSRLERGITMKEMNENERLRTWKQRIRRLQKSFREITYVEQIYPYKDNYETWIEVYDIEVLSFEDTFELETEKQEFIKSFWENKALIIREDYSPTGKYFTSDFKCAYKGFKDGRHIWHCHEYISIDV